ncbi:cupredoxin domain-containing protein [Halorarum halobium]|uniref:cupredoxin domain-containing protein n=1 Tax=Halorarum halobium TaxID=3075121 RepID=UPI0028A65B55|nr:hypothetical protein [Halobaculum sp. XH14]
MDRRTLLRGASVVSIGVAGLAGCSSPQDGEGLGTETDAGDGTEPATGTPTRTAEETSTETDTTAGEATDTATGEGTDTETGTETDAATGTETGTGTEAGTETAGGAGSYEFTGVVEAWTGEAPAAIAGRENPTLQWQAGQQVEVSWENGDGQPHDFTVQDADGNVLEQSERTSEQGVVTTFSFTVTEEMTTYVCTIHPTTMVGEIAVSA